MILSHNVHTCWRLKIHETNEVRKDKNKIKPFELVVLQFSRNQSYLSYDYASNEVVLKKLAQSYVPLDAIWEIQPILASEGMRKKK
jgi:hypothetical protein